MENMKLGDPLPVRCVWLCVLFIPFLSISVHSNVCVRVSPPLFFIQIHMHFFFLQKTDSTILTTFSYLYLRNPWQMMETYTTRMCSRPRNLYLQHQVHSPVPPFPWLLQLFHQRLLQFLLFLLLVVLLIPLPSHHAIMYDENTLTQKQSRAGCMKSSIL